MRQLEREHGLSVVAVRQRGRLGATGANEAERFGKGRKKHTYAEHVHAVVFDEVLHLRSTVGAAFRSEGDLNSGYWTGSLDQVRVLFCRRCRFWRAVGWTNVNIASPVDAGHGNTLPQRIG